MRRLAIASLLVATGCAHDARERPRSVRVDAMPARPMGADLGATKLRAVADGETAGLTLWTIESTPPGASIWFDGADTGVKTPSHFVAPAAGTHALRLSLAGYADVSDEIVQRDNVGLGYSQNLRPSADVAREEASRVAAQRPVDDRARDATRAFLGRDRSRALVVLTCSGGLSAPSVTLRVSGAGELEATWKRVTDGTPRRERLRVGPAEIQRVLDAVVAQGFVTIVGAERQGGADEARFRFALTNARGETYAVEKWLGDAHPRLDPVLAAIHAAAAGLPADVQSELELPW